MITKLIRKLFPKTPAHTGREEHPVGSVPDCPACQHHRRKRRG